MGRNDVFLQPTVSIFELFSLPIVLNYISGCTHVIEKNITTLKLGHSNSSIYHLHY